MLADPVEHGVNELSDVDVQRISLVDKGANRKRFFMFKRHADDERGDVEIAAELIAKADWSAVYCVVAEPGWLEDPGMHGAQGVADRWASEDEIRKACHRFAKNGGAINLMHDGTTSYGTTVENGIAPADFTVTGPDGDEHTIRKGSWYVAIEPTLAGRAKIEAGEISGISIEGSGLRKLVEKRDVDAAERKRLASKGHAMSDRSFPIANESDLRNAISAFGRAKNKAAARRHIIARARALGKVDLLPDSWGIAKASAFDERKHPRGRGKEGGQFVSGRSGSQAPAKGKGSGRGSKGKVDHAAKRLAELGYYKPGRSTPKGVMTATLRGAIRRFQRDHKLEVTGDLDDRTRQRMKAAGAREKGAKTNVEGFKGDRVNPASDSVSRWNALPDARKLKLMREFRSKGGKLPSNRKFAEDGSIITRRSHPDAFKSKRRKVAKVIDFAAAGGPLRHLLAYYRKFPHPFTQCVRDNRKRFGPRTENICAGLKDIMLGTQKWRAQFHKAASDGTDDFGELDAQLATAWYGRGLTDRDAARALRVIRSVPVDDRGNVGTMSKIRAALGKLGLSDEDIEEIEKSDDPDDGSGTVGDVALTDEDRDGILDGVDDRIDEALSKFAKSFGDELAERLSKGDGRTSIRKGILT